MKHFIKKCRDNILTHYFIRSSCLISSQPVLGKTLFTLLPALIYGCTAEDNISSAITSGERINIEITRSIPAINVDALDIFVFKDDNIRTLDCYQRIEHPDIWEGKVSSGSGRRIIDVCANSQFEKYEWPLIRSQDGLKKVTIALEKETRHYPFMSGEATVDATKGKEAYTDLVIRPIVSEIHLRSLCCDFEGKPYAGEKLTDIKVYLTNINAECRIFSDGEIKPTRLINVGRLCTEDVEVFNEPDLVFQKINGSVGYTPVMTDIRLWCYPSNAAEDSPGTPYSRLVIEGKISGRTFYWPININREDTTGGISRNIRYTFDIRITRKGSTDPDTAVNTDDVEIKFNSEPWNEKDDYQVIF